MTPLSDLHETAATGAYDEEHDSPDDESSLRTVSFVSDFVYVARPFSGLAPVILDPTAAWLIELSAGDQPAQAEGGRSGIAEAEGAAAASTAGREHRATVKVGVGPDLARIPVHLSLGAPRARTGAVVVPITWEPLQLERLLPSLDGDLELASVSRTNCRLGLSGRYTAPLAMIGRYIDRFALHGLAESSVRNFLQAAHCALLSAAAKTAGPDRKS
jgi:hypothetical protein